MATPLSKLLADPRYTGAPPEAQAALLAKWQADPRIVDDRQQRGQTSQPQGPQGPSPLSILPAPNHSSGLALGRVVEGLPGALKDMAGDGIMGFGKSLMRKAGFMLPPGMQEDLESSNLTERIGGGIADAGLLGLAGGAFPAMMSKGAGALGALKRVLETATRSGAGSGALTALEGKGQDAALNDAKWGAVGSGVLGAGAETAQGVGKWLAKTPFKAPLKYDKEVLNNVVMPQVLGSRGLPSLTGLAQKAKDASAFDGDALGNAARTQAFPVPLSAFDKAMSEGRSKFQWSASPHIPNNPGTARFDPTSVDPSIRPRMQKAVRDADSTIEGIRATSPPGKQGRSIPASNVFDLKKDLGEAARPVFERGTRKKATPKQVVSAELGEAARNALVGGPNESILGPLFAKSRQSITAQKLFEEAVRKEAVGSGTSAITGPNARRVAAAAALATGITNPVHLAASAALAFPMQTGWAANRVGQMASMISKPPVVRLGQDLAPGKSKDKKK